MQTLNDLFDQFLKERVYLYNIIPKTREWYQNVWLVFCRWRRTLYARSPSEPVVTRADLQMFVVSLRERGVRSPATAICAASMRSASGCTQGSIPDPIRLTPQRLEKRLLPTHDERTLRALLSLRPKHFVPWRVHPPPSRGNLPQPIQDRQALMRALQILSQLLLPAEDPRLAAERVPPGRL